MISRFKFFMISPDFSGKDNCFNPLHESHTEIRRVKATGKSNARNLIEAALKLKSDHPISLGELQGNKKNKIPDFLKGSVIIFDRKY